MPDSILLANYRAAWDALAIIREAVEELAPPGSVIASEQLGPDPMQEAEALVRGIWAIAGRALCRHELSEQPQPFGIVNGGRGLRGIEIPKGKGAPLALDLRPKTPLTLIQEHPSNRNLASHNATIRVVLRPGGEAQIAPSVIQGVPVYVINVKASGRIKQPSMQQYPLPSLPSPRPPSGIDFLPSDHGTPHKPPHDLGISHIDQSEMPSGQWHCVRVDI